MDKESFIISHFKSQKIGDDGAVFGEYVYSKDIFAEDIHFKKKWLNYKQIAIKSMLVNISDAIVMNAIPKYALIGLILPKNITNKEINQLSLGFNEIANKFGIEIIGGDTTSGEKIVISITIVSKTKKPIFRKGLKVGHYLAYTGTLGSVLKDFKYISRGGCLGSNSKFIKPILRQDFFYNASRFISCAMDISDGLNKDLSRLLKINQLNIKWFKKINKKELESAEEYEILFAFDKKYKKIIENYAQKTRINVNIIGFATRGKFKSFCKEHHF